MHGFLPLYDTGNFVPGRLDDREIAAAVELKE
jgi:hypothetical protein